MLNVMQHSRPRRAAAILVGLLHVLSAPVTAWAQIPQPAEPASAASSPASAAEAHSHADAALTRQHRMRHLAERALVPPETLKAQCRYESEITTPPPAKKIVLTFDDGPEPGATEAILKVLAQHHAPATFFMIGEKVERYPELVAQVLAQHPQGLASHSWSHPNFHDIPPATQEVEVRRSEQELQRVVPDDKLFRYPYGNSSCETNALLHTLGYRIVGWHIDTCDWAFDRNGSVDAREALECGVLAQNRKDYLAHVLSAARAHNGGIVLMHEIHPRTVAQLDALLSELEKAGFSFGSIRDADFQDTLR